MAITTAYEYRLAIQEELLSNYEEISSRAYPEDYLTEMADSWTPVYNSEIIKLWANEMPSEYDDSWKDLGVNDEDGIIPRMRVDIYLWLSDVVTELWNEIVEKKEEVA